MKNLIKKITNSSTKTKVIVCSLCAVLIAGIIIGTVLIVNHSKPNESLYGTKIKLKELPSTELVYPGLITYTDGSIPLLTKKSFYMEYKASIRFGVKDLTQIDIDETEDTITLTVPHSELLKDFIIDEDSIVITDKSGALFNWKTVDDVPKAIAQARAQAKKDVNNKFNYDQAIEDADKNIKDNLESLFAQTDKTVIVNFK